MSDSTGVVAWGCKDGVQIFFSTDNLKDDYGKIERELLYNRDFRSVSDMFDGTHPDFYSIRFIGSHTVYTRYKIIEDQVGRPGFLALSLFVPLRTKSTKSTLDILEELLGLFSTKYMTGRKITKYIDRGKLDDFENLVKSYPWEENPGGRSLTDGSSKKTLARIVYENEQELRLFFNNPFKRDYEPFSEILFITLDQDSKYKLSGFSELKIDPAAEETFTVVVWLRDESEREIASYDISATLNGEPKYLQAGRITGVKLSDRLEIAPREEETYENATISAEDVRKELSKATSATVTIEKVLSYKKHPFTIVFKKQYGGVQGVKVTSQYETKTSTSDGKVTILLPRHSNARINLRAEHEQYYSESIRLTPEQVKEGHLEIELTKKQAAGSGTAKPGTGPDSGLSSANRPQTPAKKKKLIMPLIALLVKKKLIMPLIVLFLVLVAGAGGRVYYEKNSTKKAEEAKVAFEKCLNDAKNATAVEKCENKYKEKIDSSTINKLANARRDTIKKTLLEKLKEIQKNANKYSFEESHLNSLQDDLNYLKSLSEDDKKLLADTTFNKLDNNGKPLKCKDLDELKARLEERLELMKLCGEYDKAWKEFELHSDIDKNGNYKAKRLKTEEHNKAKSKKNNIANNIKPKYHELHLSEKQNKGIEKSLSLESTKLKN